MQRLLPASSDQVKKFSSRHHPKLTRPFLLAWLVPQALAASNWTVVWDGGAQDRAVAADHSITHGLRVLTESGALLAVSSEGSVLWSVETGLPGDFKAVALRDDGVTVVLAETGSNFRDLQLSAIDPQGALKWSKPRAQLAGSTGIEHRAPAPVWDDAGRRWLVPARVGMDFAAIGFSDAGDALPDIRWTQRRVQQRLRIRDMELRPSTASKTGFRLPAQSGADGRLRLETPGRASRWVTLVLASVLAARAPADQGNPFGDLELYLATTDQLAPLAECLIRQFHDGAATVDGSSLLRWQLGLPSPDFVTRARRLLEAAGAEPYARPAGHSAEPPPHQVLRDLRSMAGEKREAGDGLDTALLQTQAVALYLVELARAAGGHCQPSPILLDGMAGIEAGY